MPNLDHLLPDRVLKPLLVVLFIAWLASWGYTASQMSLFTIHTYRAITLPIAILCLNSWAIGFALLAGRRFSAANSPVEAALSKASGNNTISLRKVARMGWWTPFGFSACLAAMYVIFSLTIHTNRPSWPSPTLPAEIMFAPMVFFFAGSSWRMRQFQDGLIQKTAEMQNPENPPA